MLNVYRAEIFVVSKVTSMQISIAVSLIYTEVHITQWSFFFSSILFSSQNIPILLLPFPQKTHRVHQTHKFAVSLVEMSMVQRHSFSSAHVTAFLSHFAPLCTHAAERHLWPTVTESSVQVNKLYL